MKTINTAVLLLRVPQWIKNFFIFAPALFAKKITDTKVMLNTGGAFLVFCLAASAVYILNDIIDRNQDRQHPRKSKRPIASGLISVRKALSLAILLALTAAGGSLLINPAFSIIVMIYLIQNILYTFWLKHVVILDIFLVAFGFVLRVMAGVYAANVANSSWLLICTILLALFLGFSKRRHEILLLGDESQEHRRILAEYSIKFLDQIIAVVTACTVMSYMLYTISEKTRTEFGTENLIFTVVFVLYGIFRYLYLVYKKEEGGSPTRIMLTDIPLIINVVLWATACGLILYYSPKT